MVWMVVVGPMRDDDIGLVLPHGADDPATVLESGQQRAVEVVEDNRVGAHRRGAGVRFGSPDLGQLGPTQFLVTGAPICHGEKTGRPATAGPKRGQARRLNFAVVGVSSDAKKAGGWQLLVAHLVEVPSLVGPPARGCAGSQVDNLPRPRRGAEVGSSRCPTGALTRGRSA